jgi:hypothetical protein
MTQELGFKDAAKASQSIDSLYLVRQNISLITKVPFTYHIGKRRERKMESKGRRMVE